MPITGAWTMLLGLIVLHGPHDVSFGVFEKYKSTDSRNVKLRHYDFAAIRFHRGDGFINCSHAESAFKPKHRFAWNYLPTSLQRTLYAGFVIRSSLYQKETWRPPRGKLPTEGFLVKSARAVHIVCMNGKVFDVIRHHSHPFS